MNPMSMLSGMKLTGGAGGASGAASGTSNNGISQPQNTPFNFDGSGWNVNFATAGNMSSNGNRDANSSSQTASPSPTASGGFGGGMTGGFGGLSMPMILGAIGLFLVLSHKV